MSRHMTAVFTATAILVPALTTTADAASSFSVKKESKKASTISSSVFSPSQSDCDLDNSGVVDVNDMVKVIDVYGSDCSTAACEGDINRDGTVDLNDLLLMLANYGALPGGPAVESSMNGISVALQSRFSNDASELENLGVTNEYWTVMGSAMGMSKDTTEAEFFSASQDELESMFGRYISRKADLGSDFSGVLVLDLEAPFHPRELGKYIDPDSNDYDPMKFDAIVEGFKKRIAVARELLPNCKLALYGFPTPHGHGNANGTVELQRTLGYELAAARGILDKLDAVCPVLYQRFGATDRKYDRIADYMKVGVDTARSLSRTDGTTPEVLPMLAFKIFNGGSAHNKELVSVEDLANQVEMLRNEGIENMMIWNGKDQLDNSTTVLDQMTELKEELETRQNNTVETNAG